MTLDTGEKVEITQSILDCMELGYAITLHKAQGSQFPRIIIALQKGRIVDRAWLYTAMTRAESEIHIVGSSDDMRQITEAPSHSHKRNSYLKELLSWQSSRHRSLHGFMLNLLGGLIAYCLKPEKPSLNITSTEKSGLMAMA
ncbi:ATP-binding domain-containing protein [Vibrio owensii]|uniref:ATP-binding domain-containing protein n=1 Tax=Vibrio owensii TaxID=696485 RepID=UPI003A4C7EC3